MKSQPTQLHYRKLLSLHDGHSSNSVRCMKPLALLALLIAATTIAAPPVHLRTQDIVGDWVSLRRCSESLYKFTSDGRYRGYCFDMIESGRWSLLGGDKIIITHYDDPIKETVSAKSRRDTITIVGFEPHSDRTFIYIRFHDGQDKWMK